MIAIKSVSNDNDLMIITSKGLTIRLAVSSISVLGRATQGVRLINLKKEDQYCFGSKNVNVEEGQLKNDWKILIIWRISR